MEFFRELPVETDQDSLRKVLSLSALPELCGEIGEVHDIDGDSAQIECLWGSFAVQRLPIRGGVRFALPTCPNALAWTVTAGLPPEPDHVVLHATINRRAHDPDFIESIEDFLDSWVEGLAGALQGP